MQRFERNDVFYARSVGMQQISFRIAEPERGRGVIRFGSG